MTTPSKIQLKVRAYKHYKQADFFVEVGYHGIGLMFALAQVDIGAERLM
jgi:hypothetical protein